MSADSERLGRAIGTLLEIIAAEGESGGRIELTASAADGYLRLDMRRGGAGSSTAGPRRKRPVMRLTVASEIVARHGGRLEIDDGRAAVELPPA